MKQSMTKSARPAPDATTPDATDALLKAVAADLAAKLASALGSAPVPAQLSARLSAPLSEPAAPLSTHNAMPRPDASGADMREVVIKEAKLSKNDAKATPPSPPYDGGSTTAARTRPAKKVASTVTRSGQLNSALTAPGAPVGDVAGGGAGAATASTDQFENSVVSKVSEVMTKTNKSTPAASAEVQIISEDEIRAMGEKDYMNPAQMAFFKARLQQLEKDLLKNAGETTEHLRETVLVPDPADRATIEEEHALELRTRDRERKLLKKVQQSIASIDAGDYGWCEETGEPIGIPRLIARPTATLSLEAQQRRELKQKLYGD